MEGRAGDGAAVAAGSDGGRTTKRAAPRPRAAAPVARARRRRAVGDRADSLRLGVGGDDSAAAGRDACLGFLDKLADMEAGGTGEHGDTKLGVLGSPGG